MEPTNQPDFQHGYSSGVEGITPDAYESYLSSQVNLEWLKERVAEKRAAIDHLSGQLPEATTARKATFAVLQEHLLQLGAASRRVDQLENERADVQKQQSDLQQRRQANRPDYSLFGGLLFLVAGVSFLAGDLIISHEIVAYALNIRNNTEAWAFAVGLAMVSILLKPAYDRLIEQPYQEDPVRNGRRYGKFKIGLALFAILTLAVLGWFRYEAYRTDQLKSAINKSIRQLQQNAVAPDGTTPTADPALLSRIETQLQQSSELNLGLVNSPWALLSFVLSGLLFALAGAVCLGIGLPVLTAFWYRWLQVDLRLWKLRRRIRHIEQKLAPAESVLTEHLTRKAVLEHDLALTPDPAVLMQQQRDLQAEVDDLLAECRLAQTDSRIANFNDGFQKGTSARQTLSDDEQDQVRTTYLSSQPNGQAPRPSVPSTTRVTKPTWSTSLHPHELLRQVITTSLPGQQTD